MADKVLLVFCWIVLFIQPSLASTDPDCDVKIGAIVGQTLVLPCNNGTSLPDHLPNKWKRGASSICDIWFAGPYNDDSEGDISLLEDGSLQINVTRHQSGDNLIMAISEAFLRYACGESMAFGVYLCETGSGQTTVTTIYSKDESQFQATFIISLIGSILGAFFTHLILTVVPAVIFMARQWYLKKRKKCFHFKLPEHQSCHCAGPNSSRLLCFKKDGYFTRFKKWVSSPLAKDRMKIVKFVTINIVMGFLDVLTDVYQAVLHFFNGRYLWSGLTMLFVFLPFVLSVIMQCSSIARKKCKADRNIPFLGFSKCLLHLPFINLYKHYIIMAEIKKRQTLLRHASRDRDKTSENEDKRKDLLDKYLHTQFWTKAKIESDFQKFKVIESIGENIPQAVLQIGITLRDPSSRFLIFTNPTIVTSVMSVVLTFTGLYLKMPFGTKIKSKQKKADVEMMQPSDAKSSEPYHPKITSKIPYQTSKSFVIVLPIMLATVFPRICNLALMTTFENWTIFSVFACLLPMYWLMNSVIFWKVERTWLKSDMHWYSIVLAIVTPCIRLTPRPEWSILCATISSSVFHGILLLVMYLLMSFYPNSLNVCVDNYVHMNLCLISLTLSLFSLIFSMLLAAFSEAQIRQVIGLCGPKASSLSCPMKDAYRMALANKWMNALKCLIQMDIDSLKCQPPSEFQRMLRREGRINWPLGKRRTLLHKVCEREAKNKKSLVNANDKKEIVELFVEAPAYIGHFETEDSNGQTPMHIACSESPAEVVKVILENGKHLAKINHEDRRKKTPLMLACEKGRLDVVHLFLDLLSDEKFNHLNYVNSNGETAFFWAVQKSKFELVELFLKSKQAIAIDLGGKSKHGQNIWHLMAKKSNEKNVALMDLIVQIKATLNQELYINDEDNDGRTPYLVSCTAGRELAFQWFLKNANKLGIDLKKKDKKGLDGLALACKYKANNAITEFLERGAYGKGEARDSGTKSFEILIGDETYEIEAKVDAKGNPYQSEDL